MYTLRRRAHNRLSDRQFLDESITDIRQHWRHGEIAFNEIHRIVMLIMGLTGIAQDIPEMFGSEPLAYWLYLNSDAFWVPGDNTDVWNHIQLLYNAYIQDGVRSKTHKLRMERHTNSDNIPPISFMSNRGWYMFHVIS